MYIYIQVNWVPIDNTMIFRQNDIEMDTIFELGKKGEILTVYFVQMPFIKQIYRDLMLLL